PSAISASGSGRWRAAVCAARRKGANLSDADSHRKFSLSLLNGLAGWNCQTSPSLTLHRPGLFLGRVLINPLSASAAQSMSASLRKRPKCCNAAKRRYVPIPDSWNAEKPFCEGPSLEKPRTTPKAGLESVGYLSTGKPPPKIDEAVFVEYRPDSGC